MDATVREGPSGSNVKHRHREHVEDGHMDATIREGPSGCNVQRRRREHVEEVETREDSVQTSIQVLHSRLFIVFTLA